MGSFSKMHNLNNIIIFHHEGRKLYLEHHLTLDVFLRRNKNSGYSYCLKIETRNTTRTIRKVTVSML